MVFRHLLPIFCWTFGALGLITAGLHYLDLEPWLRGNIPLAIVVAALVGLIPESGPHLIFVTLYASGLAPFSVLLASSISQDGHACIPLLADSRRSFFLSKLINAAVALLCGFICWQVGF